MSLLLVVFRGSALRWLKVGLFWVLLRLALTGELVSTSQGALSSSCGTKGTCMSSLGLGSPVQFSKLLLRLIYLYSVLQGLLGCGPKHLSWNDRQSRSVPLHVSDSWDWASHT